MISILLEMGDASTTKGSLARLPWLSLTILSIMGSNVNILSQNSIKLPPRSTVVGYDIFAKAQT